MKPAKIVMVGSGGYAVNHVENLLNAKMAQNCTLVAVVDPFAKKSLQYDNFKNLVPVYDTLQEFYLNHTADLAFIATPIPLHVKQCITAMENGSHVLCEKPLVPTMAELELLQAKSDATGKTIAVAFQWCHSDTMLAIKRRIISGELGRPISMKTYVTWPRTWAYYSRSWAGKRKNADGELIHDSVLTNATAHYLQNMLFLLGENMIQSAYMSDIKAECYRANFRDPMHTLANEMSDIETFDTIALKGKVAGADIFFTSSHATNYKLLHPSMDYTFENARVLINFANQDGDCVIHYKDGRIEYMGQGVGNGLWDRIAYNAQSAMGLRPWCCTIETVRPFTQLIDYVFENVTVKDFPPNFIVNDSDTRATYVKNLHIDLLDCYNFGRLPSEMGLGWAL